MNLGKISLAKSSLKHASTPWGIVTSVVGFSSDVLKPEVSFPPILLVVSLIGLIITGVLFGKRVKREGWEKAYDSRVGGFVSFCALSVLAWGVLSIGFFFTPPQGLAASNIPSIEHFQKDVLKIGQDVTEIKGTVTRIEEKLDALSKSSVIIQNPKTPEEFYHNARLYELKGNTGEAQKAYEEFLKLAPNYIDAHLAYQTLMNNTQGIEKTAQVYAGLEMQYPQDPIVKLMGIRLLSDRNIRIQKLKDLSQQAPQTGPLFFEMAEEYLRPGPGNVTIDELKSAKESFEKFKKLDGEGKVKPFYLDKKVLEQVYQKRDDFDKMVKSFYGSMIERPMDLNVEVLPGPLVSVTLIPRERNHQKIFYSIDDPNPTIDTGVSPYLKDPMTGQPLPNYQISGKMSVGKHILYGKYIDAQGKESQIFQVPFEVQPIQARFIKLPTGELGSTKFNVSIDFQSIDGKSYEFFYELNNPVPNQKASSESITLEGITGPSVLYYYGVSGGEKTTVYQLKIQ